MRIAVTGANGFLGRAVCRFALERGHHVTALVRAPSGDLPAQRVVVADLCRPGSIGTSFADCSAVIHAAGLAHVFGSAAQDEAAFEMVNVLGTDAVIDAALAARVPQLLLVSSVSVYGGSCKEACDESTPVAPLTPYARSKWRSEVRSRERFAPFGTLTILRFATIYGEGDRGNVARLIRNLQRGRFVWPGSGENRKSLIYIDDAARACLAALNRPHAGVYNVSGEAAAVREIVAAVCDALGRPLPRARIPKWLLKATTAAAGKLRRLDALERQLQKFLADDIYAADRFHRTFSFAPEVSLREGLAREVQWLALRARE